MLTLEYFTVDGDLAEPYIRRLDKSFFNLNIFSVNINIQLSKEYMQFLIIPLKFKIELIHCSEIIIIFKND